MSRSRTPPGVYLAIAALVLGVALFPDVRALWTSELRIADVRRPVDRAADDVDAFWRRTFASAFPDVRGGYRSPDLVYYTADTPQLDDLQNVAGAYLWSDETIYIDLENVTVLTPFVVAHEYAHHVQKLAGDLALRSRFTMPGREEDRRRRTVRQELQAECYAGVWAADAVRRDEAGEWSPVDAVQTQLEISAHWSARPSPTHGTGPQRARWLARGFESGSVAACDTFSPAFEDL